MKVIKVDLQVQANVERAQNNLQKLNQLLQQISKTDIVLNSSSISSAVSAARQLQIHLEKAVNVNTGKIDLGKLNDSLKSSNTNLFTLTSNLQKAGPIGQQAFLKMAQAISSADMPLAKVNDKLKNFGVTLLNTIKWQLASNLIHGVQGALQGAVSHAKELNSALNDIRIVTGYSVDTMANFTNQARQAAEALNTTTVEYSKAALIFFQQGLNGKDVTERANTVIKLAEVTGQTAEAVSSQMTAIWNNFDDGSKSLEYYADVITKLGASTASSSTEIAKGLEKFAPVADTIGLSYEKASSALATVVAETRQSADVVGTAFKTMFSRIQGLSLGDTLEDGVDLNKYSKALETVGVHILDSTGNLKEMDQILDELGKKWNQISKSSQVALAETVAGVRQYSQFMATMNNYDKILDNEKLAKDSTGTLQKQAQIWSESWEAASERVKKRTQDVYESILKDDVLIKFEDLLGGLISGIDNIIEASGGIMPILTQILMMASSTLFPMLTNGLHQLHNNIRIWSGKSVDDFAAMTGQMSSQMSKLLKDNTDLSNAERQQIEYTQDLINQKTLLTLQTKNMSEAEKLEIKNKMLLLEINHDLVQKALEKQIVAEQELKKLQELTDAEERYRIAIALRKNEIEQQHIKNKSPKNKEEQEQYEFNTQATSEAENRGRDTSSTRKNINTLKEEQELAQDAYDYKHLKNKQRYLKNKGEELSEEDTNRLNEVEEKKNKNAEKYKELLDLTIKDLKEMISDKEKLLELEKAILKEQQDARQKPVDSKTIVDNVYVDRYETKDAGAKEDEKTSYGLPGSEVNQMVNNTLKKKNESLKNKENPLLPDENNEIGASKESYQAVVQAMTEAGLVSEDFKKIQSDLGNIFEINNGKIQGLSTESKTYAETQKENIAHAEAEAKGRQEDVNATRNQIAALQSEIKELQNEDKHSDKVKNKKKELSRLNEQLKAQIYQVQLAQKKFNQAISEYNNTATPAAKNFVELKNKVHDLATEVGMSQGEIDNFDAILDSLASGDNVDQHFEELGKILERFGNQSDSAREALNNLAADLRTSLTNNGFTGEELDKTANAAERVAESGHNARKSMNNYGADSENVGNNTKNLSKKLTGLFGTLGKVSMAYNGLKSVKNVWSQEDTSLMDKIMSTFMSMSMILPILTGKYGALNLAKAAFNLITKRSQSSVLQSIGAFLLSKGIIEEDTAKTWFNTSAQVGNQMARAGWAAVAMGVFLVAAIAATTALVLNTAKTKDNTDAINESNQAKQENAKKTQEIADKWLDEATKMETLIQKYKELKEAQEDVKGAQDDILNQVPNLVKEYKDFAESLDDNKYENTKQNILNWIDKLENAAAAHNMDQVQEYINLIDQNIAKTNKEVNENSVQMAVNAIEKHLDKDRSTPDGYSIKDGNYTININGHGKRGQFDENSNDFDANKPTSGKAYEGDVVQFLYNELTKANFSNVKKFMSEGANKTNKNSETTGIYDLEFDLGVNPETEQFEQELFIKQIGQLESIMKKAEGIFGVKGEADEENVDTLKEFYGLITNMKKAGGGFEDPVEGLKEASKNADIYTVESIVQDPNNNINTAVKSFSDYTNMFNTIVNTLKRDNDNMSDEEAKELAQQWVDRKGSFLEQSTIGKAIQGAKDNIGEDFTKTIEELEEDPDFAKIIPKIEFSRMSSQQAVKDEAQYLKDQMAQEEIDAKVKVVTDISGKIKKTGMTDEDWASIQQSWEEQNLEQETGVSYSDFFKMDYNAQKNFFKNEKMTDESIKNTNNLVLDAQNRLNTAIKDKEDAEKEYNNNKQALNSLLKQHSNITIDDIKKKVENNEDLSETEQSIYEAWNKMEQVSNKIDTAQTNIDQAKQDLNNNQGKVSAMITRQITNVESLNELDKTIDHLKDTEVDISEHYAAISTALINLGENYDNCTEEVLKYEQALASGSKELVEEAEAILRNSIAIGEMSKKLNLESDAVEEQAKELRTVNKLSKENYIVAGKVAVLNQSMNKGLKELVDNWDEYKKTLTSAQKGTQAYAEAALKAKKSLAQMLGVLSEDYIPDDFLEIPGVMNLIDQAVKGDINSINKLGSEMAKATIDALEWKEGMKTALDNEDGFFEDPSRFVGMEEFNTWKDIILNGITSLTEGIQNGTIQAGQSISELMDGTEISWVEALNEMARTTGMSVDEMNSFLNELGVQADVTTTTKEVETQVPEYTTYEMTDKSKLKTQDDDSMTGYKPVKSTVTVQTGTKKVKGSIDVAQINMGDKKGTPPTITYAGRDNVSSAALTKSDSSSSSSSSKKNTSAASHTHEVHRYSNEKNMVEGLKQQYEKLNKAKDKAFGASRIKAMEAELKKLKELKKASGDYLDAIVGKGNASKVTEALYTGKNIGSMISGGQLGGTVKSDYNSLFNGLSASGKQVEYTAKDADGNQRLVSSNYSLGEFNRLFGTNLSFSLDSYGNLYNKDAILNLLNNLQNKETSAYSSVADPSASSTTEYNHRIAFLKEVKERVEQFGTTINDLTTQSDAYLEYISSVQDKNAELISEKLNNGITLSNHTLTRLERTIKVLGNNIYKSTEDMTKWFDIKTRQNSAEYEKQHKLNEEAFEKIRKGVELYEKNPLDENAITPAKAAEMLEAIENSEAELYEKQQQDIADAGEFLTQALEQWKTSIQNVTSSIDFNIEKLSHLQKVFELLGKTADFENLGIILEEQAAAAKADYEQAQDTANKAKIPYLEAKSALSKMQEGTEDYNFFYEHNYLPLAQTYEQYEKDAEAKYEEFLSKASLVHENNRNRIYQQYEQTLTGQYGSFDNLNKSMERKKSLTDEYLTKTNQIYETNKMLRSLQQDIDKTDSSIAKRELNDFAKKITALQNIEKLTKNDLELEKAKYEILKAEIALREAQIAKSTVRLRRDNEGNYGYVYTADQDKVADAEQNLADKQNDYYNKVIDQENDYMEKDVSLWIEYQEEKKALEDAFYVAGTINKQQFLLGMEELEAYFREKDSLYHEEANERGILLDEIAVEQRSEAWSNMYEDIILKQSLFNDTTTGAAQVLNQRLQQEMDDWNNFREEEQQKAEIDNEHLKETVHEVTREVENLGSQIVKKGGLADQLKNLSGTTEDLTQKFMNQYTQLSNNANIYSTFADKVGIAADQMRNLTTAQIEYNQAVANQPNTNYGTGSSGTYGPTGSGNSTSGGNNSSKGIVEDKTPETWQRSGNYKDGSANGHWYEEKSSKGNSRWKQEGHKWFMKGNTDELMRCSLCGYQKARFVYQGKVTEGAGTTLYSYYDNWTGVRRTGTSLGAIVQSIKNLKSGGYTGTWPSGKTGMYTGSWNGPDLEENGKLAFLHQKELVLNADDTENILDAVKLIRQISQTIDLQAMAYNNSAFGLTAAHLASNNQTLQQEVTIHAEFPNATDHNEIEEAFNNLVNRASQYANRY